MKEVSIIGVDLAKNVFQLHGASAAGTVLFRNESGIHKRGLEPSSLSSAISSHLNRFPKPSRDPPERDPRTSHSYDR